MLSQSEFFCILFLFPKYLIFPIFRQAIPPEKVLAIGIYRLAHKASYQTTGDIFNVGKTTARECYRDVLFALNELKDAVIQFPQTRSERQAAIETFTHRSRLPNILGAIDGTHFQIRAPNQDAEDYYGRRLVHDVVAQAVVDGNRKFMDIAAGYPGTMHDARILRNSRLNDLVLQGFNGPTSQINVGGTVKGLQPYLVGDSAYPISNALLKPYSDKTTDPKEKRFNKQFSKARVQVECAFGMLKSRFRHLHHIEDSIQYVSPMIIACAVLHNICIELNDTWPEEYEKSVDDVQGLGGDTLEGEEIREMLKEWLWSSY